MLASPSPMTPSQARRLRAAQDRFQQLSAGLSPKGFISSGSLVHRFGTCGKPNCRCHADPPQLHGPYWMLNQPPGVQPRTRHLTEAQARLYQEWIANRRQLTKAIKEMEKVSLRAVQILLEEAASSPTPSPATPSTSAARPSRRMNGRLAEALVEVKELLEPVADAAQEWLDARDEQDREATSESRIELEQELSSAGDLQVKMLRLARLLAATAT